MDSLSRRRLLNKYFWKWGKATVNKQWPRRIRSIRAQAAFDKFKDYFIDRGVKYFAKRTLGAGIAYGIKRMAFAYPSPRLTPSKKRKFNPNKSSWHERPGGLGNPSMMVDGDHGATAATTGKMSLEYNNRGGRRRNYKFAQFKSMVEAVLRSEIPRTLVLRDDWISSTMPAINQQGWLGVSFMASGLQSIGSYTASSYYEDDIPQAFLMTTGNSYGTTGATWHSLNAAIKHEEIYIRNMSAEIQLLNSTADSVPNVTMPLVVDVYLCAPKHDVPRNIGGDDLSESETTTSTTDWFKNVADKGADPSTSGASSVTHSDRGFTPFQSVIFTEHFTVLRKTKVQLGRHETYTFKLQKKINRTFNWDEIASYNEEGSDPLWTNTSIDFPVCWIKGVSLMIICGFHYPGTNITSQLGTLNIGVQKRIYCHKNNQTGTVSAQTA